MIGKEFAELGSHLVNLKKHNKVGFLVSNEAQTALDWFPIDGTAGGGGACKYNDVVRYVYDQLYKLNVECDFLMPGRQRVLIGMSAGGAGSVCSTGVPASEDQ